MQIPTRILLTILATAATSLAALAQTPAPSAPSAADPNAPRVTLETVRVTGDLWETPLERIPASVTVFDESALRAASIKHFGDLVDQIPNLTWTGGTSRPRYLQIRGIGENSHYEGETPDATVRFLVDDLDFTGLGTLGSTFDVRQVEVLRGPQAGAFGANAAGGVVRLVTNAPTPVWTGQIEATVGEDALYTGAFAVGGPLIASAPEKLMVRLAVQQTNSDGFRKNAVLNEHTNARDEFTARLRLTFNPNAAWKWDGTALFSDVNNGFDDFALDNNGYFTYSDEPGRDEQRSVATSLRGTYTGLENVRFTTVTSGSWVDSIYSYDDDWTAASYEGFSDLRRDRSVFNQELRFDSALTRDALGWIDRWTLGAYFSNTDEDSAYTNTDPGNIRGLTTDYQAKNFALFGQISHDFSARTRLIAGLRAEQVDVEGRGVKTRFRKGPGTFDPVVRLAPSFDDTLVGGKLTIEHDLTENQVLFASVTRGYKAGGVNVDARINPAVDPLTYETEYLWNYEAGLRGSLFDQKLTGEVTAFYIDRHDTQVRDSAGFGGSYRFFTDNANRAYVYGLEAAGTYALTKNWSVNGSLALMDSELEVFTLSDGSLAGGRRLANTPEHGYTLGTRYRADSGFFGNVELVGRTRFYDSNNQNETRTASNVVNASLGYAWGDWTFTAWIRNAFNETYEKRVFFFGNEDPDYNTTRYESRADPRQFGVTANYRF
ncbi:TonB-dependent receptor [Oleiharenicola lentus]|uniref:TonB-dependent receptor n=1 Tax=Oleiharenicola lentus TaxID=2508720 RepID=UPI003F6658D8